MSDVWGNNTGNKFFSHLWGICYKRHYECLFLTVFNLSEKYIFGGFFITVVIYN